MSHACGKKDADVRMLSVVRHPTFTTTSLPWHGDSCRAARPRAEIEAPEHGDAGGFWCMLNHARLGDATNSADLTRFDSTAEAVSHLRTVAENSNCRKRKVAALFHRGGEVVGASTNGTPFGIVACNKGGCWRCANPERFPSGAGYDICLCIHAEEASLATCARSGISIRGTTLITLLQPCFACLKSLAVAGVDRIEYVDPWSPPRPPEVSRCLEEQYSALTGLFTRVVQVHD